MILSFQTENFYSYHVFTGRKTYFDVTQRYDIGFFAFTVRVFLLIRPSVKSNKSDERKSDFARQVTTKDCLET